jgi:hypothetical protein
VDAKDLFDSRICYDFEYEEEEEEEESAIKNLQ